MKTLYLHIGTTKTGTSAIQEFCTKNHKVLNSKGYCYPKFPFSYPGFGKKRNALFLQRRVVENGKRQFDQERQRFLEGMDIVRQHFETYDNVVLSDEGIWGASCENKKSIWPELKDYCDRYQFEVKIIVYLRRQDMFIDSLWRQRVKGTPGRRSKVSLSWEEYLESILQMSRFDYYKGLEKIASVLGRECLIVRRYDRERFPDGMVQADFLAAIGLELTDEYVITKPTVNGSLSGNTCELKRIMNSLPGISNSEMNFLRENLLSISSISGVEYKSNIFSAREAEAFIRMYREGNRKVAKEYMGEEGADLFDMSFENCSKWEKGNPYLLDDIIRFTVGTNISLLKKMDEENAALREEIKGLKNNLRHPFRTFARVAAGSIR